MLSAVSTQHWRVTDRQTDRQTDEHSVNRAMHMQLMTTTTDYTEHTLATELLDSTRYDDNMETLNSDPNRK